MSKRKRQKPRRTRSSPDSPRQSSSPDLPHRDDSVRLPLVVLLLTVIGSAAVRLRLLSMPLERDEGEYALAGQLILQGHPPYERLYNMKWPGTYYSYALIEAVFGQSIEGLRLGLLIVNVAAIVLVYLLGRRLLDEWGAAAAAVAYALLSVSPATLGFAGHATHFVVLAALAAVLFLLSAFEREKSSLFFIAGIFAGLAPIMKQPGIVFTAFVIAYWAWRVFRRDGRDRARRLENGVLLGAGIALPLVVMVASLLVTHVMETFWVWTVEYARYYGAFQSDRWLTDVVTSFLTQWAGVIRPDFFFWVLAGLGLLLLPLFPRSLPAAAVLLGLLAFSFVGVFPGFVFRKHYFILVLPAVALLFGTVVFVFRSRVEPRFPRTARIGTAALILIPLLTSVWEQRAFYFSMTPQAIVANIYAGHPFAVCLPIADYIRTHSQPGDSIAVLGSEPQIYFYARRLPATGHIYMYSLMERQPYARYFQQQMIDEIEAAHPKFVVFVNMPFSWLSQPERDNTIFDWFAQYQARELKTVGIMEIDEAGSVRYRWNEPNMQATPTSLITVFEARSDH